MGSRLLPSDAAMSFAGFGTSCLFTNYMKHEFVRYRLSKWRILTGLLEICGAAGLLIGLSVPLIGFLAATGLVLLMCLGFYIRLRIRDGLIRSLPALAYCIINLYLVAGFLNLQD